jgi:hypothetical protein
LPRYAVPKNLRLSYNKNIPDQKRSTSLRIPNVGENTMKIQRNFLFGCCLLVGLASTALASGIKGDYLETRSADVYTGACIANSEMGLAGDEATVAWRVREGSWNGIDLSGLSVVGVVKASATLGDPFHSPYPARAVLIIDSAATSQQRTALQSFAQSMAPELLKNLVRIETAPITLEIGEGEMHGCAKLEAGSLARIETRCLGGKDHLCGNEEAYYPPLTALVHAMPAFSLHDEFAGDGLNVHWKLTDRRNAFIGNFSQETTVALK